jgi:hypothetical protein
MCLIDLAVPIFPVTNSPLPPLSLLLTFPLPDFTGPASHLRLRRRPGAGLKRGRAVPWTEHEFRMIPFSCAALIPCLGLVHSEFMPNVPPSCLIWAQRALTQDFMHKIPYHVLCRRMLAHKWPDPLTYRLYLNSAAALFARYRSS